MNHIESRRISLERAAVLKTKIDEYLKVRGTIKKGLDSSMAADINNSKEKILKFFNATEDNWQDWKWQFKNRISDVDVLSKLIELTEDEIAEIRAVGNVYRWAISPYYLSLIDNDRLNPVRLQAIPSGIELDGEGEKDPMAEEFTNPAGSITRRYPDRLIINVTNECPMYCRHCQRRRNIGTEDCHRSKEDIIESLEYIKKTPEIRDVLITGGDALALSDTMLAWVLSELRKIPHVEIIRLGTRTPVTMPQRITEDLVNMLKQYHPLFINTHFNHPLEITPESKAACERLANAGIPLGNQTVLLNGINNNKYVMRALCQELVKCRVKPYYIFHAKHVSGTTHFNTSVDDGIEIMEYLRGYTSGLCIPAFIVNAPKGKGKTPILPQYLISRGKDYIKIRNWEGEIIDYPNDQTQNFEALLQQKKYIKNK